MDMYKVLDISCVVNKFYSLIYRYISVCRFCVVRCLIVIYFSFLFSNYSTDIFLKYSL